MEIIRYSDFNPNLITLQPAGRNSKGGKFFPVTHGPGKQKFYLQTTSLHCHFGVSTYKDEKTGQISNHIDVSLKDHHTDPKMKNFHDLMPAIDDVIVSMGVENSQEWFGKPLPEGTIREFYRPLVKQPKDPKYSPIMKTLW